MPEVPCKECGSANVKKYTVALPVNEGFDSSIETKLATVMNVDAFACYGCGDLRLHLKPEGTTQ